MNVEGMTLEWTTIKTAISNHDPAFVWVLPIIAMMDRDHEMVSRCGKCDCEMSRNADRVPMLAVSMLGIGDGGLNTGYFLCDACCVEMGMERFGDDFSMIDQRTLVEITLKVLEKLTGVPAMLLQINDREDFIAVPPKDKMH